MRIALVASQSSSPSSRVTAGSSQRLSCLAQAMARLGHQVTVYAPKDSPKLPRKATLAPGVTIEHLAAGPGGGSSGDGAALDIPAFSDHLARRWQQDPPDVAHAHFWTTGLAALAGARGLNLPVVQAFDSLGAMPAGRSRGADAPRPAGGTRRGRDTGRPKGTGQQLARIRLEVGLARNASAVLATSSDQMTKLAGLGVPRASIRVVPWGVDTGQFAPEGPVAKRNGRPRLLAVRESAGAGLDTVVRALAEVPAVELLIAGGPSGSGPHADPANQALAALARQLGVAGRVTFTGEVSRTHLPALLRSADLLLSGAWEDPFATVALQAMACGTPVAAAAVGAVGDAVIDGTTGILVPPGQPSLLAHRIRSLLASPLQLDAFSVAAVDRARSRYSWDRIGQETVRAYERCLPHQFPAGADAEEDDRDASQEDPEPSGQG
ncbi:MAG TPA: glycosyltransferase [Streptosporangiaceae bacterium]|nr:glycosyltransferase [Streptosporangiaceae bacterium]